MLSQFLLILKIRIIYYTNLFFTSLIKTIPVIIVARKSEIGNEIHAPISPKNKGNINIKGTNKIP
jgi:hypothetical protein